MKKHDLDALKLCVSIYRKSSPSREMEVRRLLVQNGWKSTALRCCRMCQQASLKLPSIALTPSELKAERIGNLNEIWLVDRHGRDEYRTQTAMLLRKTSRNIRLDRFKNAKRPRSEGVNYAWRPDRRPAMRRRNPM